MYNLLSFASVMKSVGGVVLAVVILLAMVTIHEFGHYLAGKLLGFKINEFSVGFGPAILKKRSKKTGELFALRVVPLGGYCAFEGEDEADEAPPAEKADEPPFAEAAEHTETEAPVLDEAEGKRFNDQPPWKRIIVLLAGATMNYLLALVLIIATFAFVGRPLYRVQVERPEQSQTATVATVAAEGLQTGDIVLRVDGANVYMLTDYIDALNGKRAGEIVTFTVLRDGETLETQIPLAIDADFENMSDAQTLLKAMNIYGLYTTTARQSFFSAVGHSFVYSVKIGGTVLRSLGELLTGKLALTAMGGPVTTIKLTSEAASSGILSFLNIASFIGVNLAVFNLLPIPALDGCKVIFCIIEWIRRKPVNRKVEAIIHFVGIIFIFAFAILVDILQLFV